MFNALTVRGYSLGRPRCVAVSLLDTCCAHRHNGNLKAGILPGLTYYLSAWYPKTALARRIGILYAGSTLANAFGGLLAFAIEKMKGCGSSESALVA